MLPLTIRAGVLPVNPIANPFLYVGYDAMAFPIKCKGFPGGSDGKESACDAGDLKDLNRFEYFKKFIFS